MGPCERAVEARVFVPCWGPLLCEGPKSVSAEKEGGQSAGGQAQRERKRPAALHELGMLQEIKPNVGRPEWLREKPGTPKCEDGSPESRKRAKRAGWGISLAIPSETPPVEVIKGRLYIGTRAQAQNWTLMNALGTTHIVNVSRDTRAPFEGKLMYHQCGIPDTETSDIIAAGESALRYIRAALERGPSSCVLVHCASGVSRSVAVVIYYLMRKEGMNFETAMSSVRAAHPAADPNRGFVEQLRALDAIICQGHRSGAAVEACVIPRVGSCVSRDGQGDSDGALTRALSWARMPSLESVGWMTRTSYPPARDGGWVMAESSSAMSWVAKQRASSQDMETPLGTMKEEEEEEDAGPERPDGTGEDIKHDEDCKSEASTSLALSEGAASEGSNSELSEGETELSEGCDRGASADVHVHHVVDMV